MEIINSESDFISRFSVVALALVLLKQSKILKYFKN